VSRRVAVVDTNVVVAGLVTSEAASPVAKVLDGMLGASFTFAVSAALLAEYRDVLMRPKIRKAHGLSPTEVEAVLVELARQAIVLTPPTARQAPDPGDQFLWDLLAARADLVLVTGDATLQRDAFMRGRVVSPRAFIEGDHRHTP
jgi:putative PIN family toxin of toxin-antitoxin system